MAFASINSSGAPIAAIEEAFATEPSLKKRVYDAIGTTPQHTPLFEDIAKYTSSLLARTANTTLPSRPPADGPAVKKRKLQNGESGETAQASVDLKDANAPVQFYVKDVSFATPQRKKLTLEITAGHQYLRARNQATKEIEFGVSMDKIKHALCLPVPEKTQKQFNFCIIPEYADGITPPPEGTTTSEAMVFTIADGPAKAAFSGDGQQINQAPGETADVLLCKILNENMRRCNVVRPDDKQFVSAMPEAHRKGEKAYHVKAFRGSKEGYLFLLSTGILFAFKKPLLFFSFDTIDSVSYTSVLQRTFNLNVMARPTGGSEEDNQEFEFSMIDQADFSGIDTYIKRHGLQDASLADARRAKVYNVNKPTGDEQAATEAADGDESELQKAQRELEDQEEEDEEDYDPGSDDSEGSGSSSDEDDDDDEEEEEAHGSDEDMEGTEELGEAATAAE
ncbi:unnamed protein product [Penicillium salamii]|uniref:Histone chaperone RTT106/FACT complex subunit SPT16-like middle domain-containing protein n=1 Tax=Penicillium salamii TaxID=1612424 RepID=A0A9W4I692_9EURO|nr:unnamed protein product [Penicillium salamii]CAG8196748.1 unnamed protein product [Penicillium salamii]CAG8211839.1 unnamed protein product [Penicillium salamii]CAG8231328.1 unnamed protein product [Penicillium salamii]CAG8295974.1 unnamed protein product [Penicillium salamii]